MIKSVLALSVALWLTACAVAGSPVSDISSVQDQQIVLVGRFFIYPELNSFEREGQDPKIGKIFFRVGPNQDKIEESFNLWDKTLLMAEFGKTFFVRAGKKPILNLNGIYVVINGGGTKTMVSRFPVGGEVKLSPENKYFYIGDIHLYRDEFSKLTKVKVSDEFTRAEGEFRVQFKEPKLKLTKSLLNNVGVVRD